MPVISKPDIMATLLLILPRWLATCPRVESLRANLTLVPADGPRARHRVRHTLHCIVHLNAADSTVLGRVPPGSPPPLPLPFPGELYWRAKTQASAAWQSGVSARPPPRAGRDGSRAADREETLSLRQSLWPRPEQGLAVPPA